MSKDKEIYNFQNEKNQVKPNNMSLENIKERFFLDVRFGKYEYVKSALEDAQHPFDLANATNQNGLPVIIELFEGINRQTLKSVENMNQIISLLYEKGADLNVAIPMHVGGDMTPLSYAIWRTCLGGDIALAGIETLIKHGATPTHKSVSETVERLENYIKEECTSGSYRQGVQDYLESIKQIFMDYKDRPQASVSSSPAPAPSVSIFAKSVVSSSPVPPAISEKGQKESNKVSDKALLDPQLGLFTDSLANYPSQARELLTKVCTPSAKTKEDIQKFVDSAFVGVKFKSEDDAKNVKNELTTDLHEINKLIQTDSKALGLSGQYSTEKLAKMAKDIAKDQVMDKCAAKGIEGNWFGIVG